METKTILILGFILAGVSVILGAFGAHGLQKVLEPKDLSIFETAVKYQFFHSLGLIALGILSKHYPALSFSFAAIAMLIGIIFFSGSLYLLVGLQLRWMGAVTPLGGLAFIVSWFQAAWVIYKN